MLWTSRPNTAPARGTPNTAPNPAEMPATSSVRRSGFDRRSIRAALSVRLADICTAVPSRPAEPPKRLVATVESSTRGAMRRGMPVRGSWISSMIRALPSIERPPV